MEETKNIEEIIIEFIEKSENLDISPKEISEKIKFETNIELLDLREYDS